MTAVTSFETYFKLHQKSNKKSKNGLKAFYRRHKKIDLKLYK